MAVTGIKGFLALLFIAPVWSVLLLVMFLAHAPLVLVGKYRVTVKNKRLSVESCGRR